MSDMSETLSMLADGWMFTSFQGHLIACSRSYPHPLYLSSQGEWEKIRPVNGNDTPIHSEQPNE